MCTANICRSASAERLLREAIAGVPELVGVEVRSAGTAAWVGAPGCSIAPALAGHAAEHRSRPLTADLVSWADLILPAARDHRSRIVELDPTSRARTFTLRQAGRIADWVVDSGIVAAGRERADRFPPDDPRRDVPALPAELDHRWAWLVDEMDAARGRAGVPVAAVPAGGRRSIDPSALHPDDVPDPHVLGSGLHPVAYEQISASTSALVRLLREVVAQG